MLRHFGTGPQNATLRFGTAQREQQVEQIMADEAVRLQMTGGIPVLQWGAVDQN